MNIQQIKANFHRKNQKTPAYFVFNEKLNKYVAFVYDYNDKSTNLELLSDDKIEKLSLSKTKVNPLTDLVEFLLTNNNDSKLAELISDFYLYAIESGKNFATIKDACLELNKFAKSKKFNDGVNKTNRSVITGHIVNEDGTLSASVYKMEVVYKEKNCQKYCYIKDTETDFNYRGNGLHYQGMHFLEGVLANKMVYTIVGESDENGVFVSSNGDTLDQHYQKMGFEVHANPDGKSTIIKSVDPTLSLNLFGTTDLCR